MVSDFYTILTKWLNFVNFSFNWAQKNNDGAEGLAGGSLPSQLNKEKNDVDL